MVRTRISVASSDLGSSFRAQPTSSAASLANVDPSVLMEALKSGKDINEVVASLSNQQKRETALNKGGIMKVRLVRNMPIKQSAQTGRWYCLATLLGGEGIVVQGGRQLTPAHMQKLGSLEVDLGMSEALSSQIEDYRSENGGNHYFELVLNGESQITQLQARFPAGHENARENVFLIDPTVDVADTRNWTAKDTGNPLMKTQIRVYAVEMLDAGQATIPGMALPESDDDFEAMLEQASKVSSVLQAKGLDDWRNRRDSEAKKVQESLTKVTIKD